jgi:hypothetical protein
MAKKRGKRWYTDFTIRGRRFREAIPEARTQAQAERAEAKLREEVYQGRYGNPGDKWTLAEFVQQRYKYPPKRSNAYQMQIVLSKLRKERGTFALTRRVGRRARV